MMMSSKITIFLADFSVFKNFLDHFSFSFIRALARATQGPKGPTIGRNMRVQGFKSQDQAKLSACLCAYQCYQAYVFLKIAKFMGHSN